jgi:NADPH:quinone reductase-like Zn-dependent oxidoreductase
MKAWLYSSTSGGLENNLELNPTARAPPAPQGSQVLIQVLSASLNPADYKVPELGLPARLYIGTPASPGMDICGRVVTTGPLARHFREGQLVFGSAATPIKFGSLAEYTLVTADQIAAVPEGVDVDSAAGVGIAGQTAFQSLEGYVRAGDKVLINGASGGCGTFEIQIAKQMGCRVTAICSTRNMELCLRLGADEVIDYTAEKDLVGMLAAKGTVFDHILDHIGTPAEMYYQCHRFLKEDGVFVQVGASSMTTQAGRLAWPAFLGGGRRRYVVLMYKPVQRQLVQLGEWLQEGVVKVQVDSRYEFEEVVKAFEKLRSGRARGKIVVHVGKDKGNNYEPFGIGM